MTVAILNHGLLSKKFEKLTDIEKLYVFFLSYLIKKDDGKNISFDVVESVSEGFGGELKGKDKEKFEKARKENAEQLGYKLTGKGDIREAIKFSKEEMTQLHQNGKLEKDGYTYVYKEK